MAKEPFGSVLHYIRQIVPAPVGQEVTDQELLKSFAAGHDEAAFALLMQRHGQLVWSVCRRVLRQTEDAEDAFQATFLVLARKAGRIRWHTDVSNWLYAVAWRTAVKAKSEAHRRLERPGPLLDLAVGEANGDAGGPDIRPVMDEELNRLPLKYRAPVVLHYFEGKTYAEAAQLLGWPAGTVSSRLAQARQMLRGRLARRGITVSIGLLATTLAENTATAMLPAAILDTTVKAASLVAVGQAGAAVSTKVASLTNGVLKTMFLTKLKIGLALGLTLGALGTGVGVMGYRLLPTVEAQVPGNGKPENQIVDADQPQDDKVTREIERLRQENEDLRREMRALRDKIAELELKPAAKARDSERVLFQGKPADYWLQMLKDRDPGYRQKAIDALGAIGVDDERVIPALVASFKDKNPSVQNEAAQALAFIGKEAVPRLLELLKGKDSVSRKWAAVTISNIGPEAKDTVPALIECLEDEDANLHNWAASALGHMAPESKAAIPALIKALEKSDPGQGQQQPNGSAVDALSRFHQLAVPALNEALKDPNVKIRAGAAGTLALIGNRAKDAIPNLISALKDKNEQVRQNAGMAVVNIGRSAVPALIEALKDKDPAMRVAAVGVLGSMGSGEASSAASALVKAMGDEDKRVREAAAQAYNRLGARADP